MPQSHRPLSILDVGDGAEQSRVEVAERVAIGQPLWQFGIRQGASGDSDDVGIIIQHSHRLVNIMLTAVGGDRRFGRVALHEAEAAAIVVVQSSRAGSGRIFYSSRPREWEFLSADNLNPQKARLLLAPARLFDMH